MKFKLQIHLKLLLPVHNVLSSKNFFFLVQQFDGVIKIDFAKLQLINLIPLNFLWIQF